MSNTTVVVDPDLFDIEPRVRPQNKEKSEVKSKNVIKKYCSSSEYRSRLKKITLSPVKRLSSRSMKIKLDPRKIRQQLRECHEELLATIPKYNGTGELGINTYRELIKFSPYKKRMRLLKFNCENVKRARLASRKTTASVAVESVLVTNNSTLEPKEDIPKKNLTYSPSPVKNSSGSEDRKPSNTNAEVSHRLKNTKTESKKLETVPELLAESVGSKINVPSPDKKTIQFNKNIKNARDLKRIKEQSNVPQVKDFIDTYGSSSNKLSSKKLKLGAESSDDTSVVSSIDNFSELDEQENISSLNKNIPLSSSDSSPSIKTPSTREPTRVATATGRRVSHFSIDTTNSFLDCEVPSVSSTSADKNSTETLSEKQERLKAILKVENSRKYLKRSKSRSRNKLKRPKCDYRRLSFLLDADDEGSNAATSDKDEIESDNGDITDKLEIDESDDDNTQVKNDSALEKSNVLAKSDKALSKINSNENESLKIPFIDSSTDVESDTNSNQSFLKNNSQQVISSERNDDGEQRRNGRSSIDSGISIYEASPILSPIKEEESRSPGLYIDTDEDCSNRLCEDIDLDELLKKQEALKELLTQSTRDIVTSPIKKKDISSKPSEISTDWLSMPILDPPTTPENPTGSKNIKLVNNEVISKSEYNFKIVDKEKCDKKKSQKSPMNDNLENVIQKIKDNSNKISTDITLISKAHSTQNILEDEKKSMDMTTETFVEEKKSTPSKIQLPPKKRPMNDSPETNLLEKLLTNPYHVDNHQSKTSMIPSKEETLIGEVSSTKDDVVNNTNELFPNSVTQNNSNSIETVNSTINSDQGTLTTTTKSPKPSIVAPEVETITLNFANVENNCDIPIMANEPVDNFNVSQVSTSKDNSSGGVSQVSSSVAAPFPPDFLSQIQVMVDNKIVPIEFKLQVQNPTPVQVRGPVNQQTPSHQFQVKPQPQSQSEIPFEYPSKNMLMDVVSTTQPSYVIDPNNFYIPVMTFASPSTLGVGAQASTSSTAPVKPVPSAIPNINSFNAQNSSTSMPLPHSSSIASTPSTSKLLPSSVPKYEVSPSTNPSNQPVFNQSPQFYKNQNPQVETSKIKQSQCCSPQQLTLQYLTYFVKYFDLMRQYLPMLHDPGFDRKFLPQLINSIREMIRSNINCVFNINHLLSHNTLHETFYYVINYIQKARIPNLSITIEDINAMYAIYCNEIAGHNDQNANTYLQPTSNQTQNSAPTVPNYYQMPQSYPYPNNSIPQSVERIQPQQFVLPQTSNRGYPGTTAGNQSTSNYFNYANSVPSGSAFKQPPPSYQQSLAAPQRPPPPPPVAPQRPPPPPPAAPKQPSTASKRQSAASKQSSAAPKPSSSASKRPSEVVKQPATASKRSRPPAVPEPPAAVATQSSSESCPTSEKKLKMTVLEKAVFQVQVKLYLEITEWIETELNEQRAFNLLRKSALQIEQESIILAQQQNRIQPVASCSTQNQNAKIENKKQQKPPVNKQNNQVRDSCIVNSPKLQSQLTVDVSDQSAQDPKNNIGAISLVAALDQLSTIPCTSGKSNELSGKSAQKKLDKLSEKSKSNKKKRKSIDETPINLNETVQEKELPKKIEEQDLSKNKNESTSEVQSTIDIPKINSSSQVDEQQNLTLTPVFNTNEPEFNTVSNKINENTNNEHNNSTAAECTNENVSESQPELVIKMEDTIDIKDENITGEMADDKNESYQTKNNLNDKIIKKELISNNQSHDLEIPCLKTEDISVPKNNTCQSDKNYIPELIILDDDDNSNNDNSVDIKRDIDCDSNISSDRETIILPRNAEDNDIDNAKLNQSIIDEELECEALSKKLGIGSLYSDDSPATNDNLLISSVMTIDPNTFERLDDEKDNNSTLLGDDLIDITDMGIKVEQRGSSQQSMNSDTTEINFIGESIDDPSCAELCFSCNKNKGTIICECHEIVYCSAECVNAHWPDFHANICKGAQINIHSINEITLD